MRFLTAFLLVLVATVVAPLVIASSWVSARVEDRQEYVKTVAPLADEPRVRKVLAEASAKAAVSNLQQYVPVGLPSTVGVWANKAATTVVESPDFPEFWRKANNDLHRQVLDLLEDPDASSDGRLTVDASPLLAQVLLILEERGIPVGLVPDIELLVPIVSQANVVEAGPSFRASQKVARLLPALWAGLVLLAILVAAGWRGRVRTAAFALLGVALAAAAVRFAAGEFTDYATERASASQQDLTKVLLDAVTGSLAPYAGGFLWALPFGVVLFAVSLWPKRRRTPTDSAIHDAPEAWPA